MTHSHSSIDESSVPTVNQARWTWTGWSLAAVVGVAGAYFVVAYLLMPTLWLRYAHRHPALDETPGVTLTGDDHPGDPINIALVGSRDDVENVLAAAKWYAADPLGIRSDLKIAADTVLSRPFDAAPVSNLYLFGRKEDLAFEQPVGDNPRKRHHVRFWKSAKLDEEGRPLWVGSATYDERVGVSHTTGQITHHIAPDVDTERDHLLNCLQKTGEIEHTEFVSDFHKVREGRNGGGDPWRTDGRLPVATIKRMAAGPGGK